MVCGKCQKKLKQTELATPGVKRKSEMYYGSPSTSLGGGGSGAGGAGSATASKAKPTLGGTRISKVCLSFCFAVKSWENQIIGHESVSLLCTYREKG
jgi:hypothetical protein